jgi:hypothetical protein
MRFAGASIAALVVVLGVAHADVPRMHVDTEDLSVFVTITSRNDYGIRTDAPKPHRLFVEVEDRRTERPLQDAAVTADIAESGHAGTHVTLQPRVRDGRPGYEVIVPLVETSPGYRILVHVRPAGATRVHEAAFTYKHFWAARPRARQRTSNFGSAVALGLVAVSDRGHV